MSDPAVELLVKLFIWLLGILATGAFGLVGTVWRFGSRIERRLEQHDDDLEEHGKKIATLETRVEYLDRAKARG